jgi:hypothetical protein
MAVLGSSDSRKDKVLKYLSANGRLKDFEKGFFSLGNCFRFPQGVGK